MPVGLEISKIKSACETIESDFECYFEGFFLSPASYGSYSLHDIVSVVLLPLSYI